MGPAFQGHFLYSQFRTLPYPTQSFKGQTIIVTGANTGLGYDAALHFVRLGATRVILGCRSKARGDRAAAGIAQATGTIGVAEVWELDLAREDSVKAFARRCEGLDRIDAVVENAGVNMPERVPCGRSELIMVVNVYNTFLLLGLLLPKLKRVADKYGNAPVVTVVTSETHHWVPFEEGEEEDILAWLDDERSYNKVTRYWLTKLVQIYAVRELAERLGPATKSAAGAGGSGIVLNMPNPGLCKTEFGRDLTGVGSWIFFTLRNLIGRTSEVGSRNLVVAAGAGPESHGRYIVDCEVNDRGISRVARSEKGRQMQKTVWEQLRARLQAVEPGIFEGY